MGMEVETEMEVKKPRCVYNADTALHARGR
jgi:hypothetical protein